MLLAVINPENRKHACKPEVKRTPVSVVCEKIFWSIVKMTILSFTRWRFLWIIKAEAFSPLLKRFAKCVVKGIFFRNEQTWRLPYLFLSCASHSRRIQAGTNKRKHKNELHHLFTSELTLWNKYTEWGASELLRTRGTLLFIQGQAKTRTCFNRKWRNILGVLHILFIHIWLAIMTWISFVFLLMLFGKLK